MPVTFDSAKSERNEAERGLAFGLAEEFDWSTALMVEDTRRAYAERRYQALGMRKPNPELIDDDAPEATDEWFKKARPAKDVLPGLVGKSAAKELLKPKRGRPVSASPKEHVNIRLDADVLSAFKGTGSCWQTRLNNALRDWLRTHA